MDFFRVVSVEDAKNTVKKLVNVDTQSECVPLSNALGRRAAKELRSPENLPYYDRSTVDGYAVRASDTYGATESIPALLKFAGSVEMGEASDTGIKKGETMYVPTGGALPEGADSVVMIEYSEVFDSEIALYRPASVRDNVVRIGDDIKKGEIVLNKFGKVTPLNTGALAALGISSVDVLKPLRFSIISTGDELVGIDEFPQNPEIRDVNTQINRALCESYGFSVVYEKRVKDNENELKNAVSEAAVLSDVILVSGGSSVGKRDFTQKIFSEIGKILAHGISMKPGKPTLIADIDGKPAIGLPGHPLACLLTLKLILLDAINEMYGDGEPPFIYASAALNFPSSPGRTTVMPLKISFGENETEAYPLFAKSGLVSVLSEADAYTVLPQNREGVAKGERIKAYLLKV